MKNVCFFIVERQHLRGEGTGVDITTIKTNFSSDSKEEFEWKTVQHCSINQAKKILNTSS